MPLQRTGAARAFIVTALPLMLLGIAALIAGLAVFGSLSAAAGPVPAFPDPQSEDLGLDLDQPAVLAGGKTGLTILYDAATAGEMHPCPT